MKDIPFFLIPSPSTISVESLWNHGLTIILVSSLSSRILGLTYDYAVDMSGAGSDPLAGSLVLWSR